MANLASSAVVVNNSYLFGGTVGKRTIMRNLTLTLTGQGGSTNLITAAVLGFNKIEGCTNGYASPATVVSCYPAVPAPDGSALYLIDLTQATDANRAAVADLTSITLTISVWGTEV